ncbi:hypothetical protein POTOM_012964 [Populus tomentosa]|uniref:Reverse transcriptase domain-containing protein n=1 Tax=Populus tomentosa TaxID=118781 RepID=A0A8X8D9T5_POPTO|nr:hypothetical protein POTOM_012964 [Populus tomentosa]
MMPTKTEPTPKAVDQTSWADRVRISDSSTRFTLENLARQLIGHRFKVSEAMLMENSDQWSRCMVGFFPGYKMPYHAVNKIASRVWKQCGLEHVTATANGFMIFRFNTEENMHSVLEKGPWMFGGKNIIMQQWHPRFQFDKNKISTLPVWIRLHGLPFPLWSKQGLSLAASMIGRPLSCDEQTYNCTRLEYARVCVEIDAALPYVQNFEIDSPLSAEPITVTVDYEWKPSRCGKCRNLHHKQTPIHPSLYRKTPPLTSADPSSSNVPLPTIPCITTHIAITTTTDPPSPSLPSSLTTHCPPPSLDPQPIPNTIPIPSPANPSPITLPVVPHAQPDLHIPGNEADTFHPTMPHVVLDTAPYQESKMASLSTTSESSQTATTATTETFSNFIANDDASPSSSPKTVRKKKGAPTPQPPLQDDITLLYPKPISDASKTIMLLPLTNDEIKAALFSIPDNKAPGPDGYNAFFFKKCWHIIGTDFIAATRYFFTNNSLPRCVNATRVALVPKVENPSSMHDFRPISCCNILYKCISKIIVSRLKSVLNDIIGPAQSAFLPGRSISDAILLTQELMHNSHLSNGPSNCALKIDLQKAFDTVSWEFILAGLKAIALPQCMINWIKICISTAHYTINMNGELHGFFKSTRGLRQGDPLSPYLFVFAMEGLGGLLRNATQNTTFKYHWQCKQNSITHLCFADDLMLFCNADTTLVGILKSCLDKFSQLSGLNINHAKSFLYLSGVNRDLHHEIQQQIGFQ